MATRNSSGMQQRRVRLDGNRPRTRPKCRHHRMDTKPRPAMVCGFDRPDVPPHLRQLRCNHGAVDRALHGATT